MTWEQWQEEFWGNSWGTYKDRTIWIEGAGDVAFYRAGRKTLEGVKGALELRGVESLEIIESGNRGYVGASPVLIQNPNLISKNTSHVNLLD